MHNSTAKLWWSAAKYAYVGRTRGMKMNHLFPSWYDCSSPRRYSPSSRGLGVHWNSLVKAQLGDLIYENSFKPFTTLTNPVQVHWANSKVALSLFIGFQLHQHSTPEPSRWKEYITVAERHGFFFKRLKNESSIPKAGANRCKALSVLCHLDLLKKRSTNYLYMASV